MRCFIVGLVATSVSVAACSPQAPPPPIDAADGVADAAGFVRAPTDKSAVNDIFACAAGLIRLGERRKQLGKAHMVMPWVHSLRIAPGGLQVKCEVSHPTWGEGYVVVTKTCDNLPQNEKCARPEQLIVGGVERFKRPAYKP